MNVEVHPSGGWMQVKCWSKTHDKDQDSGATRSVKVLSWKFTANAATRFWCSATRQDGKQIPQFAVFGNGVPRKSSTWRVDSDGKVRLYENGKSVNDNRGICKNIII